MGFPPDAAVRAVLARVAPGHGRFSVQELAGSYSNHTHRVRVADGRQFVVARALAEIHSIPAEGSFLLDARREAACRWRDDRISAVLDWEEAACGDPGVDVAYCRMEFALVGLDAAADEFLRVYERETGRPVANLGLWELAAAVRPMFVARDWLASPVVRERLRRFIAGAERRMTG